MKKQAVVNAGITFRFREQKKTGFETTDFKYENGIIDYVTEIAGEDPLTAPTFIETERRGRDREDKPEYKTKLSASFCFSNKVNLIEYYHNSSWLEHGGAPEKATKNAFVYAVDAYIKKAGKYQKKALRALFPEEMSGHLDVIEGEVKAMFMDLAFEMIKEYKNMDDKEENMESDKTDRTTKKVEIQ